jgi:hypothetical protein
MYQSLLNDADKVKFIRLLDTLIGQAEANQVSVVELQRYRIELLQELTQSGHAGAALTLAVEMEQLDSNTAYRYYRYASEQPLDSFKDSCFNYPELACNQQDYLMKAKAKCHELQQETILAICLLRKIEWEMKQTSPAQNRYGFHSHSLADERLQLLEKLTELGHVGAAVELGNYEQSDYSNLAQHRYQSF